MKKTIVSSILFSLISFQAFAFIFGSDVKEASSQEINTLKNPGFENGLVGWTNSGGLTFSAVSGANAAFGKRSAAWDANSNGDSLSSDLQTIPSGLHRRTCIGSVVYKGGDANIELQVVDGSANVLSKVALAVANTYSKASVTFTCPAAGTFGLKFVATADAAELFVDQALLGVGGDLTDLVSTSEWVDFSTGLDDSDLVSNGTMTASSVDWRVYRYRLIGTNAVEIDLEFQATLGGTADTAICGTVPIPPSTFFTTPNHDVSGTTSACTDGNGNFIDCFGEINDQGDAGCPGQFEIAKPDRTDFALGSSATMRLHAIYAIDAANVPSTQKTVQNVSTLGWSVGAQIVGSADTSLGLTDDLPGSEDNQIIDSTLSLATDDSQNASTRISCDGAVATGATCAGSEVVGITYNQPRMSSVLACANFVHKHRDADSTGNYQQIFNLGRMNADGTSILEKSHSATVSYGTNSTSCVGLDCREVVQLCKVFKNVSAGEVRIDLLESSNIDAAPEENDIDGSSGDAGVYFTVFPVDQQLPQAILLQSRKENIDVTGSNNFTAGSIFIEKNDSKVTITQNELITFSSNATPESAVGLIPAWARPDNNIDNLYSNSGTLNRVIVESDGTLAFDFTDFAGSAAAKTDSGGFFSITYSVDTN